MPTLPNYAAFAGRHYETGSVHNMLAYQGFNAPHTNQSPSEALLLGISGGITVGYFTFEYEGYDPHIALLTRNTFDPLETLLDRLAAPRDVQQSSNADKAHDNLVAALERGQPVMTWPDRYSLPYSAVPRSDSDWATLPLVVYGVDGDTIYLTDGADVPLAVDAESFTQARARVKKDRFRQLTLDTPDWDKLPGAVQKGIWSCISLMTEAPPKGKKDNFGLAALDHWAKMLTNTRNARSWARFFAPGRRMFMALAGDAYHMGFYGWVQQWGTRPGADRSTYADFLDEASDILSKPALREVAETYRESADTWTGLAEMTLPDDVEPLREARELIDRRHTLFVTQGGDSTNERRDINTRLHDLREAVDEDFPLSEAEVTALRERLAEQVLAIRAIEGDAVAALQAAMA